MEARKEPLYVENLSTQAFKEIYPSQSTAQQQLNLFESDDLIANASEPVTNAEQRRIKKLNSEIVKQKDALTKVSDVNEEIKILANISGLKELILVQETCFYLRIVLCYVGSPLSIRHLPQNEQYF
jgi:hypothetical protein